MNEPDPERDADPTPEMRVDPAALAGNPFERKASWRNAFRGTGSRGWGAAALAVGVLVLGWRLQPTASTDGSTAPVAATSPDGVARLSSSDPRALRDQIASDLRAAGVQPSPYEQLGINGIDAELPRPLTPEVRAVLDKHRIPVPPTGTLRIEIAAR
jgi:hypothetical protein